jgi:dihydroorotate dehydrogenase (NAD+) catalytic subunit
LEHCILTASGTAGFATELAAYGELSALGAVVTKSLAAFSWEGNPAPRVTSVDDAMMNAVGLSGPGVDTWRQRDLPALLATGARVVASVWGRTVEEFGAAALAMRGADVVAVEVNASCPNLDDRSTIFAHSPSATAAVVTACRASEVPLWVKLSPNTPDLIAVATSAVNAGASALVLTNTVLGMSIDVERRAPSLGNGGGGLSGPPIFPMALRAVYDCRAALPTVPIVGVGGVRTADQALQMFMAGASAVEVGTASFANPRAPWRIQRDVARWLDRHGLSTINDIIGGAHG